MATDETETQPEDGLFLEPARTLGPVSQRRGAVNDPTLGLSEAIVQRFSRKIVKSPRCWFWVGAISTPDGYGRFTWQQENRQRTMLAHRFALLAAGVALTEGLVAEHECNEPLCVRVDSGHVHGSSQAANIQYAVRLGRHVGSRPGSAHGNSQAARSIRIRAALADGWDADAFRAAIHDTPLNHPTLF